MTKNFNDILDGSVKFGDSQRVCFKKGFEVGQQSKQAEVDELKREMLNKTNEAYADGQKSMRKMIKSNEDELRKRIDEAMKYVSESPLKDVSRRAMINFMDILKGNTNDH